MINSIQYLRAFAAIIVVLFHANGAAYDYFNYTSPLDNLLKQGGMGVDIFFVISGFIIAFMVIEKNQSQQQFLINRLSRIAPPYWFITALIVLLFYSANNLFKQLEINTIDIISSLTFSSWAFNKYPIIYVGWTLTYELLFYTTVLLFFKKFKQLNHYSLFIVTIIMSLLPLGLNPYFGEIEQGLSPLFFLQFISGIALYLRQQAVNQSATMNHKNNPLYYTLIILLIFSIEYLYHDYRIFMGNLLGVILLYIGLWLETKNQHYFKNKLFILFGNASYAIYLLQVLTIPAVAKLLLFLSPPAFASQMGAVYIILATSMTVLAGIFFYYFIEKRLFTFSQQTLHLFSKRMAVQ